MHSGCCITELGRVHYNKKKQCFSCVCSQKHGNDFFNGEWMTSTTRTRRIKKDRQSAGGDGKKHMDTSGSGLAGKDNGRSSSNSSSSSSSSSDSSSGETNAPHSAAAKPAAAPVEATAAQPTTAAPSGEETPHAAEPTEPAEKRRRTLPSTMRMVLRFKVYVHAPAEQALHHR